MRSGSAEQTAVMDAVAHFLAHEPRKESRSRIKRLRGRQAADYRLRIGRLRVFYSVEAVDVLVLRVMNREQTAGSCRKEER
jgi:mRNA-degrading endonuclease RelE of RelBE toxin-antitoxin system